MADNKGIIVRSSSDAIKPDGVNHLLVIAIDEYVFAPRLHNCVRDADALIDVLTRKYRFNPEHVETIFNADATRENILEAMHRYREKMKPEDCLLIYFSGHGEVDGKDGYWVPVEAKATRYSQYISSYDIKQRLNKIDCFHICVIVDACFSGAILNPLRNINPGTDDRRSRWALVSSDDRQVASDGTPGSNSPFATSLLRHLNENEVDLGLHLLASKVIDDMRRVNQTPVCQPLDIEGHNLGQFVFLLRGQNTFVDSRDGKVYRTVEINGRIWMAQNLNYNVEGSLCYDEEPWYSEKFGRLYSFDAAIKACPVGWRLPTIEEWKDLISMYATWQKYVINYSWLDLDVTEFKLNNSNVNIAKLFEKGENGLRLNLELGGLYRPWDSVFVGLGQMGFYWSQSLINDDFSIYYLISFEKKKIIILCLKFREFQMIMDFPVGVSVIEWNRFFDQNERLFVGD